MDSILIKNGHVVDPAQGLDENINVFIRGGKIECLTHEEPAAELVIDAFGKIVCPGFIDIHMHEDIYNAENGTFEKSMAESALRMGVTLQVGGNCGLNVYEPAEYLDAADRIGFPVNIGLMAGHTFLRDLHAKCSKYESAEESEIKLMVKHAESLLERGCLGISFGVKYIPGTTWEEIISLVKLCRRNDKLVSAHVRQDVDGVFDAALELAEMGREGGVKVQFSHVGSMGGYGQMEKLLKDIDGYRKSGIDMMCDCYPYDAFSTFIGETTYDDGFLERYQAGYDSILIVNGKYAGKRCDRNIFEELRKTAPDTATVGYFMRDSEVELALKAPFVMLGSDGVRQDGKGHPRASGAFARFIKKYVATGKVGLSCGIGKMTSMAAERLNVTKKGNLRTGSDADVVIFDLDKVCDKATYEDGQIPSVGFDYVIIGGDVAVKNDIIVNDKLGRAVRR